MQITLIAIGKTDQKAMEALIEIYTKRLAHYIKFELQIIPDLKNNAKLSQEQQKEKEGKLILKQVNSSDNVILLDENGKSFSSVLFAQYLQKKMNSGLKRLVFVIGGPYGFSPEMYARSNGKVALSQMTFSHQMIRLFFTEQLYRAFTILNNEPYHHQ